jgi:uroporphyrinogen-III decarboxylase
MSGRVILKGNIDPGLLLNGPKSAIAGACAHLIETLGPGGGLIVADGYNVCPGTPLENLAVLRDVAREFGAPKGWGRAGI